MARPGKWVIVGDGHRAEVTAQGDTITLVLRSDARGERTIYLDGLAEAQNVLLLLGEAVRHLAQGWAGTTKRRPRAGAARPGGAQRARDAHRAQGAKDA